LDILTYIKDLNLFREECKLKAESGSKFFSIDGGIISYNVSKIPVFYNGLESACLVRVVTDSEIDEFNSLTSIENIGEYVSGEYVFAVGGEDKYNAVYDQSEVTLDDGSIYKPPSMIGVFA